MRRPLLAGNWKMNGRVAETRVLLRDLRALVDDVEDRDVVVAPPFTALAAATEELEGSPIELAAQNAHAEPNGAFTGEISPAMLVEVGCRWAILGHSERRQLFGETDEGVNRRLAGVLRVALRAIVCVGETLEERDAGREREVVERQTAAALKGLDGAVIRSVCVAYEPVWAIGTGRTATPGQAQEMHRAIRSLIAATFGDEAADSIRILYGGSVKPDNVDSLMAEDDIDGALVGGASLDAESFARIVRFRS